MRVYCAKLTHNRELIKAVYFTSEDAASRICENWVDDIYMKVTDGDPEANLYEVGVMECTHKADDIMEYFKVFDSAEEYYDYKGISA